MIQVKIDEKVLIEIDETMMDVLSNDLLDPITWIEHRIIQSLNQKCDECYKRLEKEWKPILENDLSIPHFPKSKREMVKLIVSRPEYKNRKAREEQIRNIPS